MANIILISCVSKKLNKKARAKDLYISPLFKFNLRYAKSLKPNKIFILSAKYGLVPLEKEIDPYNQTLMFIISLIIIYLAIMAIVTKSSTRVKPVFFMVQLPNNSHYR